MRRLLVAASAAILVAGAAACGNNDEGNGAAASDPDADGNTAQVCADAELVQFEQAQQLDQELAALQAEGLDQEEFEEQAVDIAEQALRNWADGLAAQAEVAEDPELAGALTGLSDGLIAAAPQLTFESLETGQIPGAEDLDTYSQALTELCAPAVPEGPGAPPPGGTEDQ
jgi:hypothetical protein